MSNISRRLLVMLFDSGDFEFDRDEGDNRTT